MDDSQLLRYSRHILLDAIGIEGQQKICEAHALVIGAGGLGSAAAIYLASAGIGKLTIVDHDTVELTNLQRQILHTTERLGWPKVASAAAAIAQINPEVVCQTVQEKADAERLRELCSAADIVLDCCDNFRTRHAVNQACVQARVPLVSGAAMGFDGQISVYDPREPASPCYACLFPPQENYEEVLCSTMGVFAPLVGIIGTMQAAEALKTLMGVGRNLQGRLLLLDGMTMEWNTIGVHRHAQCPVCASALP